MQNKLPSVIKNHPVCNESVCLLHTKYICNLYKVSVYRRRYEYYVRILRMEKMPGISKLKNEKGKREFE